MPSILKESVTIVGASTFFYSFSPEHINETICFRVICIDQKYGAPSEIAVSHPLDKLYIPFDRIAFGMNAKKSGPLSREGTLYDKEKAAKCDLLVLTLGEDKLVCEFLALPGGIAI